MNNFKNIVYSHSEYFDVLDIFLEEQKKFGIEDILVFSDKKFNDKNEHFIYDKNDIYTERLINCLNKVKEDVVLFQHEDMFLYKEPDIDILNRYVDYLRGSEYSFLRLCKTGNCKLSFANINLYEIDPKSPDFFAVQPTLWKTKDFISFLSDAGPKNIWDLELTSSKIKHNIKGLMHYANESPRGGHFDSSVWPYIATAIIKGDWNFREYNTELSDIAKIDQSKRDKFL
tara:strand:- start:991 stop:1677 length:687 start_codon:yes stop_codon:yes gene_type:complete